ncbi:DUF1028 domain-containing protein [Rhizobium sp. WYJ-E13]|uniref:DUF1028 domain-containing protein n=1 Tax=Rhizobium sp. WYJ-E13 TaxID=2849093 RepID=UPI001C1EEEB0|nr:DUF1028 domain-containing protein [Rhizobium sp. WYJ-E13]QWW67623.1 DUF1028 domain-containing protein [Rhizobium sp. WYJ-E13]
MTWSIVARDPKTGYLGIAVATRFFAVGGLVPHVRGGIGAVATQAFVNPLYGTDGVALIAEGKAPDEIIAELTARDAGRDQRQLHLIDAAGRNAAFTGTKCIDWAGHLVDDNVSVAGNMLAGPEVVAQTLAAYKKTMDKPFIERLLEAMQAGEDAGGDKRGKQSAALLVHRDQDYPWLSIRADDHPDPLAELRRLYAVAQERYMHVAETMATKANPNGMIDRREIDEKIAALEAARIAEGRPSASFATPLKT